MASRGTNPKLGFTLIELMLVMAVVLVALLTLSQSLVGAVQLTDVNRETALATDGAREMIELLQGHPDFSSVFALYNEEQGDDPGGWGSAPGPDFSVDGLEPADDDLDGRVGEIRFPAEYGPAGLELREAILDQELSERLGMPRDLNGDGFIDTTPNDRSGDYQLLPVSVELRWKGATGVRELSVQTLLADP